jgi:hypothetical protein
VRRIERLRSGKEFRCLGDVVFEGEYPEPVEGTERFLVGLEDTFEGGSGAGNVARTPLPVCQGKLVLHLGVVIHRAPAASGKQPSEDEDHHSSSGQHRSSGRKGTRER